MSVRQAFNGLLAFLAVVGCASLIPIRGDEPAKSPEVVQLFNGRDLTGWSIFVLHKDGSDSRSDPKGVFKVEGGLIHVSGEEFGALTTEKEYENYHLTVEFKWGEKRWPPRENVKRDSGILYHCVGPDKIWTKSIECQIQEQDCGDFWLVDGTSIDVGGKREKNYHKKTEDAEKPFGQWNTVEVICEGGKVTHIVNSVVVNKGTNASVTKGKILLQSEGAEIFFHKVELRPLAK